MNQYHKRLSLAVSILILASLSCQALTRPFTKLTGTPTSETSPVSTDTREPGEPSPITPPTEDATQANTQAAETAIPANPVNLSADQVYPPAFADYPAVYINIPSTAYQGLTLPVNEGEIQNLSLMELTSGQKTQLLQNGFVVAQPVPGEYREFYQIYEAYRYAESQPLFVTTDAIYHVYHLIFDKMLRDLERDSFIPALEKLTSGMLSASIEQMNALKGTPLEEPAKRNVAFAGVAAQLLGLPDSIPDDVKDLVSAEITLIEQHNGAALSPIWDRPDLEPDKKLIEDYGQYIPRGHYTRSEELKRYFKAMMWYGRLTFRLRDSFETQRALLFTQVLRTAASQDGVSLEELWKTIYDPTVFIVGKSDDLSIYEYGAISDAVFGENASPGDFADQAKLDQFTETARQLPPPQVNSMWVWIQEDPTEATQGFRVMGQRFTLDEYVFGQLIWRRVGDETKPRMFPKGLDFFAAMGSQEALTILNQMGETQYANYSTQMTKVQGEINQLQIDSWTQNLYWSWLYALQPLIAVKDNRFPAFMQSQAWSRKELNTALGSWTELKHDTILYAKQVMAEMGGGGAEEPPHGYVEPNPEAYGRLLALAQMTQQGLEKRSLLSEVTRGNLENLGNLLTFLKDASEKELAHQELTTKDYDRIRYIGGELEALTLAASDREDESGMYRDLSDQKAALIADVATGMDENGVLSALEEAIGQPSKIFVVLPSQPYQVAVGAVFSYYEFTVPSSERMTDEQWQAMLDANQNPSLPEWTQVFITP